MGNWERISEFFTGEKVFIFREEIFESHEMWRFLKSKGEFFGDE